MHENMKKKKLGGGVRILALGISDIGYVWQYVLFVFLGGELGCDLWWRLSWICINLKTCELGFGIWELSWVGRGWGDDHIMVDAWPLNHRLGRRPRLAERERERIDCQSMLFFSFLFPSFGYANLRVGLEIMMRASNRIESCRCRCGGKKEEGRKKEMKQASYRPRCDDYIHLYLYKVYTMLVYMDSGPGRHGIE
jgi:hypothetical protein